LSRAWGFDYSANVRFAPKATELLCRREMTRWANRRHQTHSFDHFVGAREQEWRPLRRRAADEFD
jgi:hypothetical protein